MATGQSIRDRLASLKKAMADKAGVLPMAAFYGRELEVEKERGRMYREVGEVMRMTDDQVDHALRKMAGDAGRRYAVGPSYSYLDMESSLAIVNKTAGPLEYLVSEGELQSGLDEDGMGGARFHTALRIRDLFDGAQLKGLRSPSLSGAGGGGAPTDIRGFQLDCMRLLKHLRDGMDAEWAFPLIEAVVWKDEWFNIWPTVGGMRGRRKATMNARRKTIYALHYALDCAGQILGYMPPEDITRRWPDGAPAVPAAIRNRKPGSTASNQLGLLTSQGARKA